MTTEELLKLRSNALNHENKTGYPHLDRSHLQFHTEEEIKNYEIPDISLYALIYNQITKNKYDNLVAIDYFGRKITYSEFLSKINEYASAFKNLGIEKGEVVSIASPNIPEVFYSIYALNKIGAVANLIDPRNNLERIKQYINQVNSTKLIMLDIVYPKIMRIIDDTHLTDVYTVSASDSLPLGLNYIQSAKTLVENHRKGLPRCPKNDIYQPLVKKVSENKEKSVNYTPIEYINHESVKDNVAIIINTSGTTGTPKGVMLTNENVNSVGYNYINNHINVAQGDVFLGIMPCFLAYGMGLGTHMPFVMGLKNIVVPSFKVEDLPKLILKNKAAHFAGVPTYFEYLMNDKKFQKADLSFIKFPCAGGDRMDPNLKMEFNKFLKEHNCKHKMCVGYGLTEDVGIATSQYYIGESTPDTELYTVGIPTLYNTVRIVSLENGEDLKVNQDGEILFTGNAVMKGYVNNPEETDKVIEVKDGERYLHTGDIGHVDEEGRVYHVGRIKRMIVRPDGHNVFPIYIENVVSSHPFIKECTCVGLKDTEHINGQIPVAFITIKEGYEAEVEKIIEDLKEMSLKELPERDVALEYIVLDEMPITENGKVNFTLLENYKLDNGKARKRI